MHFKSWLLIILLLVALWVYFCLMSVEPDGPPEHGRTRLGRKFLFPGDVVRAACCISPFVALKYGYLLDNNHFITSLALTTAINPLMLFTPGLDSNDYHAFWSFAWKWSLFEIDRFLKTAFFMFPFFLLSFLPFFSLDSQSAWISHYFSFWQRLPDCLELPIGFYIVCLFVLTVRTLMLFGLPQLPTSAAILGWFSGAVIIIYFYNLTGKVHLAADNWEAPVTGVISAFCLKLSNDYLWAGIDMSHDQRRDKS